MKLLIFLLSKVLCRLENVWKSARWLQEVVFNARNKHSGGTIPLGRLLPIFTEDPAMGCDDSTCATDDASSSTASEINTSSPLLSIYSHESKARSSSSPESPYRSRRNNSARVVRIFAAYDCGLPEGASVRLQITLATKSYEVVSLVVEQLAKAAIAANGKSTIDPVDPDDCCLVSVLGSRERRIRDDFALLRLQYPWSAGRLYVRFKHRVLDAVQRGNEALV